jgi:hypothetical protein
MSRDLLTALMSIIGKVHYSITHTMDTVILIDGRNRKAYYYLHNALVQVIDNSDIVDWGGLPAIDRDGKIFSCISEGRSHLYILCEDGNFKEVTNVVKE